MQYAGFWLRLVAIFVDVVVVIFLFSIIRVFGVFYWFDSLPAIAAVFLQSPLIFPAYFLLFTGLSGQTPGKMLLGLKVIDSEGEPPGLRRAAMRELIGKFLSSIVLYMGFFWAGWDGRKQGWHDKIAETFVVRVEGKRGGDADAMP